MRHLHAAGGVANLEQILGRRFRSGSNATLAGMFLCDCLILSTGFWEHGKNLSRVYRTEHLPGSWFICRGTVFGCRGNYMFGRP